MRKHKLLALLLVFVLLVALVAGCSAPAMGDTMQSAPGSAENGALTEDSSKEPVSSAVTDRKLIRRIRLKAETNDMATLLSNVEQRLAELNGYVENREVYNGSSYTGSTRRSATLILRIPADKLDSFVSHVSGISNIVSNAETSDDVTLKYTATESRLKVLRAEEERLLAFMAEAKTVSEMISIESRLTEVLAEIETLTSQLKLYDNLVDYGTVTLNIDEVKEYTQVDTEEKSMWEQISTGFVKSLKNVIDILKHLVIFFFVALPYFLPILIPAGIIALILFIRSKKKKKKEA